MTPEEFLRIRGLFEQALDQAPELRTAFLKEACGNDADLLDAVQNMLAADQHPSPFDQPVHAERPTSIENFEGRRIGSYLIHEQIGQGGMGVVYRAERADETFQKTVAFKVVRPATVSEEVLKRFHQERLILAALEHPCIARLIDGGSTPEGLPYLVMEYVEGTPIDQYCDEHRINVSERLRLFRSVCDAVQYAHRNLVVHRDLKPSNILVTHSGEVKLLDFGIAKLLGNRDGETTIYATRQGIHLMTPEYASPEQIKAEPITTSTDVYSLGVVLYELLTGHRPYRIKSRLLHELARVICEEEPTRPSTVIHQVETDGDEKSPITITPEQISQVREGKPAKLKKRLSGDLDNILLLALRKEPQCRYSSVEQFREDVERHLAGLPVRAQTDSLWYRTRKFVRRNRMGVAAAAMLGAALITVGASIWQASDARGRADALRVDLMFTKRRLESIQKRGAVMTKAVIRETPPGWMAAITNHYFSIQLDRRITRSGKASLSIQSDLENDQHDSVAQTIRADEYRRKRLRWSAYAKCEGVQIRAGLWMQVNAKDRILGMDDQQGTPIIGTRDWQQYAVVIDVPEDSVVINFGMHLGGIGKVWFDDPQLEVVGPEVQVTDRWRWVPSGFKEEANRTQRREQLNQLRPEFLPTQPVNLRWE
jgi:serine/threonine protein kinase